MKRLVAATILALALCPSLALARTMMMTQSHPAAQEVMDGNNTEYSVHFDGPVDHRQALLSIIASDGKTVSNLRPLLDAAPNVLFATGPRLPAGDYQMRWIARSTTDGDISSGYVPFTVKK